jgi:hypothetical protein
MKDSADLVKVDFPPSLLWLPILLGLPGSIVAGLVAEFKYNSSSWGHLLLIGLTFNVIWGIAGFFSMRWMIQWIIYLSSH